MPSGHCYVDGFSRSLGSTIKCNPGCPAPSWAPNGCGITASACNCSNRTSLFFFLTLPLLSCMGVDTFITGSIAESPAFFLCWASTRASKCSMTALDLVCLFFACWTSFCFATSTRNLAANFARAILWGCFWGAVLVRGYPGRTWIASQPRGLCFSCWASQIWQVQAASFQWRHWSWLCQSRHFSWRSIDH